jgi:hypothetical protein
VRVDRDQKKIAANVVSKMAPSVRRVLYFLNSREIVNFLGRVAALSRLSLWE